MGEHPHHWTDPDNKDLRGLQQCQRLARLSTPIPGTEFEIYNARTGNLVDTVETDKNGVASSRPLPPGPLQNRGIQGRRLLRPGQDPHRGGD
ncbi:prealbumin-like fold domain-containing protein [Flavonifractor plautii]|nr:prealbumin-like fold domain-containing protein [Flavonifractor plautii]